MNSQYRILWFDDSQEYIDSLDTDYIETCIKNWGFNPEIKFATTPASFRINEPYDKFDLIVIDKNLDDSEDGQIFISELRHLNVYTEVIFYSATDTTSLWDEIAKMKIEGVYISDRNNIDLKIESVGRQSIRKVLDLDNMRGLVMAEVSELDQIYLTIIRKYWSELSAEEKSQCVKRFCSKYNKWLKSEATMVQELETTEQLEKMLELSDSNKLWQIFNRLRKKVASLKEVNVENYPIDILAPRNFLAHGKPEFDGGKYKFLHEGSEMIYNPESSLKLRLKILEYQNILKQAV